MDGKGVITTAKRYYWIKLKENFFKGAEIKKLRKIAGGDTFTVIYLKLQLLSMNEGGYLYYDNIEPTFHEEMALILDEDPDNVQATIMFLQSVGLLEKKSETEYFLTEVPYVIGTETDKAELMRNLRQRRKGEIGNNVTVTLPNVTEALPSVTKCYTEKEKDIDKDIDKDKKSNRGKNKFSPPTLEEVQAYCIERGNNVNPETFINFYESKGWMIGKNKMKNWKACIHTWEQKEQKPKKPTGDDVMREWLEEYGGKE